MPRDLLFDEETWKTGAMDKSKYWGNWQNLAAPVHEGDPSATD